MAAYIAIALALLASAAVAAPSVDVSALRDTVLKSEVVQEKIAKTCKVHTKVPQCEERAGDALFCKLLERSHPDLAAAHLFASLPNGEVELKLLDDNGTAVEGAMVTLKQAEVDLPPVSARKQAISRGGVTMVVNGEKEQFLYTATDTGSKYSFSFYLQKTTKTYDTEVAQEDFPDLSQQLGVEPPVLESKADKAAWVDMLLPLFTTVSGSKSKVSVVFNVPLTLSLACRDLQKAGAEGEVDAVVRAVVATDGGERELGTTEKISGNSPDFKQTITATMLSKGQTLVFSLFDSADKLTDDDVIGTAVVDGEGLYELNATKRLELKLNNREGVAVGKSSLILSL